MSVRNNTPGATGSPHRDEARLAGTTWVPTTTQNLPNTSPTPRFAFLGFCERAETVTMGHVVFWKQNLLGVSLSRVFHVFPINLRGMIIAMAVYRLEAGDTFKMVFRGTQGEAPFEVTLQIASAVVSNAQPDSKVAETTITSGPVDPGWVFLANPINSDIIVNSAGTYEIFLTSEEGEQYLGLAVMPMRQSHRIRRKRSLP